MFLTKDSHASLHVSRDLALVALSVAFWPFSICLVILAKILSTTSIIAEPKGPPKLHNGRQVRVLVTGVGMVKGLFLVRSLYLGGCTVISADFEKHGIPACGRFSSATSKFYGLKSPTGKGFLDSYINQVLKIIRDEEIDIWVSCSGVATAMEDASLMHIVEKETRCKSFQFDEESTFKLDNKYEFMRTTTQFGLDVPTWGILTAPEGVSDIVNHSSNQSAKFEPQEFILKNVAMDDKTRGALPLLSTNRPKQMKEVLESLDYEDANWIMQQYIPGNEEYCTHALIVNGHVRAFNACPSASVLMHYRSTEADSPLFQSMLRFTQTYATGMYAKYGRFSGHLSFDFLALTEPTVNGMKKTLLPIECNPRCHTAVVHFRGFEQPLASAYLSLLRSSKESDSAPRVSNLIVGSHGGNASGFYWIAHDLIVLFILPLVHKIQGSGTLGNALRSHLHFWEHVFLWKDPTFEWWDPLPWFVLNHIYWPGQLVITSCHGIRWSQINVSTGKIFAM